MWGTLSLGRALHVANELIYTAIARFLEDGRVLKSPQPYVLASVETDLLSLRLDFGFTGSTRRFQRTYLVHSVVTPQPSTAHSLRLKSRVRSFASKVVREGRAGSSRRRIAASGEKRCASSLLLPGVHRVCLPGVYRPCL